MDLAVGARIRGKLELADAQPGKRGKKDGLYCRLTPFGGLISAKPLLFTRRLEFLSDQENDATSAVQFDAEGQRNYSQLQDR
jgi:hypothetical protein